MGKVEAFTLEGLKVWINSSDQPQHIHIAMRGKWEIRVFFLECTDGDLVFELKWGRKGPASAERATILRAVVKHRVALLLEWEDKVCKSK